MQQIVDFLLSSNGLAFGVALLIFIITLFLVVKRLIGFLITLLLLAFAIVSGFFVANQDLLRNILKNYTGQATPEEQDTLNQLKAQFYKGYEELKTEIKEQKDAFSKILDKNKQEDQKK
jgi:hypothetical protein